MRNLLVVSSLGLILAIPTGSPALAQDSSLKEEMRQVKLRQKQERTDLKLQQKYRKGSMKGQPVPRAVRIQMKHDMQRQARDLRERQKNERQELKDRRRIVKETQKNF